MLVACSALLLNLDLPILIAGERKNYEAPSFT
jgi:hypothetical protein